jgi:serine protease AprX
VIRFMFVHYRIVPLALASAVVAALVLTASPAAMAANPARSPASPIAPGLQRQMQVNPAGQLPVIVQLKASAAVPRASGDDGQAALSLVRQHGRGDKALGLIRGASGVLAASEIDALSHDPRVAAIYEDVPVRHAAYDGLVTAYPIEVGAKDLWGSGHTGLGITVAVLDSGIAQDPDLTLPTNRILTAVNFADPLPLGVQDPGGHGTHVAGIIGGNGTKSDHQYVGIAPNANLVDVRVLDTAGVGSASSVIAGIQWVVVHKNAYGIRVLNMSLGAPPATDWVHDPITAAAEVAWLRGIVVVSAAGNGGAGAVDSPAIDPHIISVGAVDDQGTPGLSDDTIPIWSGWGTPLGSDAKPDVLAPGRRIVSLRAPGSTLDRQLPDRVVPAANGTTYFRLSGTSMSAGVISGAVALLLEAHPTLKPDQVKALLTTTAKSFGSLAVPTIPVPSPNAGVANAAAAVAANPPVVAPRGLRLANVAAQALYPVLFGQPLSWKDPTYAGINWSQVSWTNLIWDNLIWDNLIWDNFIWDNLIWDNASWNNLIWDAATWNNLIWDYPATPTPPD